MKKNDKIFNKIKSKPKNSSILLYDSKLITNNSQIEFIKTGTKNFDNPKK